MTESYSLDEVSGILGVTRRALERRIQEGAFPGRYLAPGLYGLEMRIPATDVELLGKPSPKRFEELDERINERSLVSRREPRSIQKSKVSRDPDIRGEFLSESEVGMGSVVEVIGSLMEAQKKEISALRHEVYLLREKIGEAQTERLFTSRQTELEEWIEPDKSSNMENAGVVEGIVKELDELEAMVMGLENKAMINED